MMSPVGRLVRRSAFFVVAGAIGIAAVAATRGDLRATPAVDARFHLKLLRAEPALNETLTVAPKAVHLWFSEAPEVAVSGISMITAAQAPVAMSATRVGDEHKNGNPSISATIEKPLTAGTYYIRWRATSKDGHLVKGSYKFVLTGAAGDTQ